MNTQHQHSFLRRLALALKGNSLAFALVVIALAGIAYELSLLGGSAASEKSLRTYAEDVVAECKSTPYAPTCYEEKIPALMDKISMEDAFRVTKIVQDIDRSYQYCHVLGHKLSAKETAKDPSKWQEVVMRCPSGLCSNGCIHGAFQQRFRKESLTPEEIDQFKPQFRSVCDPRPGFNPTGLEQASCYHALGHLSMYVTNADIDKSLSLCRELSVKKDHDFSQLCFDGAFMQIFQPLEPDDFALISGKEVDRAHAKGFCDRFTGTEQGSCWSESWPLFRADLSDPKNLVAHCDYLPSGPQRERCFDALMYVITAQTNFDPQKIGSYCSGMPADKRANCYAQASSRLIETDYRNAGQAVAICQSAASADKDGACFKELLKYSTYNYHPGSDAFNSFCDAMPEPWKDRCLAGEGSAPSNKRIAE